MTLEDGDGAAPRPGHGPGAPGFEPARLESWSVGDLGTYIAALRAEIARAESEVARRERQRLAADSLFRLPPGG